MKPHSHFSCEDCNYYQALEKDLGACHRFPPVFSGNATTLEFHHWKFPLVLAHNWCGEFQKTAPAKESGAATTTESR